MNKFSSRASKFIKVISAVYLLGGLSTAQATVVGFTCNPVATAVWFGSRVHLQCTTGYGASGAIVYFALPAATSSDIEKANELQSMAMTAISTGKQLGLYFDDADTSGASFGCGADDCRRLLGTWIAK